MQVLFPKHVWLHTEYMPTLDSWTGASYLSLHVITVTRWITSGIIIHHRSNAYESFLLVLATLLCCYCCHFCYYYSVVAAVTHIVTISTVATAVTLLLLLLLFLATSLLLVARSFPTLLSGKNSYSHTCNLLAPLIQQLGVVCRQQIVSGTVAIILLCYWYFACRH